MNGLIMKLFLSFNGFKMKGILSFSVEHIFLLQGVLYPTSDWHLSLLTVQIVLFFIAIFLTISKIDDNVRSFLRFYLIHILLSDCLRIIFLFFDKFYSFSFWSRWLRTVQSVHSIGKRLRLFYFWIAWSPLKA